MEDPVEYAVSITAPRPYFAEVPYYLWGQVDYHSEGDCTKPTDRNWKWLELTRRDTGELLDICGDDDPWSVSGEPATAARAAMFLTARCGSGDVSPEVQAAAGDWAHAEAMARARRVAEEFGSPRLSIFDSQLFWGSWKWIGWFGTSCTWVGRWIMVSVLKGDGRGVSLCIKWLRAGTYRPEQSAALRQALTELTGESYDSDMEWVRWYDGSLSEKGANQRFPEPDFDAWLKELKHEYGE